MDGFEVFSNGPVVLGLLFEGADPSAALIRDGRIVAFCEEERFARQKHASGVFPIAAARYCLREAGIGIEDVDYIAVGWEARKFPADIAAFYLELWHRFGPCSKFVLNWQLNNLNRYAPSNLDAQVTHNLLKDVHPSRRPEIRYIPHHFAHACSAFMLSGFDDAAIITADGHGEDDCTNVWVAEDGRIRHLARWRLPFSLGWFYTKFTEWFGFQPHDGEGKLMGLAAYGTAKPELFDKVRRIIRLTGDEKVYHIEPRFFLNDFVDNLPYTREWLDLFGSPRPRESKEPFSDYHKNLAFAVQDALEQVGCALTDAALEMSGKDKLCVAGGTFMNCKMNGVLAKKVGSANFFAQPAAGDNGVSRRNEFSFPLRAP